MQSKATEAHVTCMREIQGVETGQGTMEVQLSLQTAERGDMYLVVITRHCGPIKWTCRRCFKDGDLEHKISSLAEVQNVEFTKQEVNVLSRLT